MSKIDPRQGAEKKFLGVMPPTHPSMMAKQHAVRGIGGMGHPIGGVQDGGTVITSPAQALPHAYSGDVGKSFTGRQVPTSPGMRSRIHDLPHAAPGVNHARAHAQRLERHAMAQATGQACLTEAYSFSAADDRRSRPRTGQPPKADVAPAWLKPSQRTK